MITHSPEFKISKLNNYDNTVLNVSRQVYEQHDMTRLYPKNHFHQDKPSKDYQNLGHFMGAGNRAYLYGSWNKKKGSYNNSRNEGINPKQLNLSNELEIKDIRSQKHYDSNIKNEIMYQHNLLEQKATELDLRSQGVQRYGYQPLYS